MVAGSTVMVGPSGSKASGFNRLKLAVARPVEVNRLKLAVAKPVEVNRLKLALARSQMQQLNDKPKGFSKHRWTG